MVESQTTSAEVTKAFPTTDLLVSGRRKGSYQLAELSSGISCVSTQTLYESCNCFCFVVVS